MAKVEDEAPLHVGAAHQVLCGLDRVNGLGANLALFGTQSLTFAAENAGGTSREPKPWSDETVGVGAPPTTPRVSPSPAAVTGEAWRALSQAAALVDAEGGGAARHLPQMSTDLSGDAAPGLILVGAQRAGPEAGSLEVEVAASHTGTRVFRLAAAPQTFTVAALTVCCAGQPTGAGAHCGQRAVRPYLPLHNPSVMPFSHPGPPHLEMTFSALGISGFRLHYCFLPSRMLEGQQEASLCAPP